MRALDNKDRIGALLILAFSLVYLRYAVVLPTDPLADGEGFTARTLPIGLSITAIVFSLLQLFFSVQHRAGTAQSESRISHAVRGFNWRPTVLLILLMGAYSLAFSFLGFRIASFLFLYAGFLILGERRHVLSVAVAGGLVTFLWFMLVKVFGLYLDSGRLLEMFTG